MSAYKLCVLLLVALLWQHQTKIVTASTVDAVSVVKASSTHIVAGLDVKLRLLEGDDEPEEDDYVAFISTSTSGCLGAAASKRTVLAGEKVTTGTGLTAGTYKVCYATEGSGGNTDSDFDEEPATLTVVSPIIASLIAPNAMPATATENTDATLTVTGGSIVDGDFIAFVPADLTGCDDADNTAARIFTVSSGTISLGTGVGKDTWKVCTATAASLGNSQSDYVESSLTFTTVDAELSAMVVLKAKPSTFAAGVSVAVDFSGDSVQGDYVAFVLESSAGCLGAGGTGFAVGSGNEVAVSVATTGSYRTCYATAASSGDEDTDYRDMGLATVTVEAPSVTALSVRHSLLAQL